MTGDGPDTEAARHQGLQSTTHQLHFQLLSAHLLPRNRKDPDQSALHTLPTCAPIIRSSTALNVDNGFHPGGCLQLVDMQ